MLGAPDYRTPWSAMGPVYGSMGDQPVSGEEAISVTFPFSRKSYTEGKLGNQGDLCWTLRDPSDPVQDYNPTHGYSTGRLNEYLASDEGRARFSKDRTTANLRRSIRFLGVQLTGESDLRQVSRYPVTAIAMGNVAPDAADVCVGRDINGTPRSSVRGDNVYVLIAKVPVPVSTMVPGSTKMAWQLMPVQTTNGHPPAISQRVGFSANPEDDWIGGYINLGTVTTHGANLSGADQHIAATNVNYPQAGNEERLAALARLARTNIALGVGG